MNMSGVRHTGRPRQMVAIQAIIWTPVGMAMSRLTAAKNPIEVGDSPVVNMWCTHSPKLRKAVAMSDSTMNG